MSKPLYVIELVDGGESATCDARLIAAVMAIRRLGFKLIRFGGYGDRPPPGLLEALGKPFLDEEVLGWETRLELFLKAEWRLGDEEVTEILNRCTNDPLARAEFLRLVNVL